MRLRSYLYAWWRLSRVPFLSVGVLPLILGFVLAWRMGYRGSTGMYLLSSAAVILIMGMTYYFCEWNDQEGERLNPRFNPFSGGSRIPVERILPAWVSLFLGCLCLAGAILVGLTIYLRYPRGHWALLLGGMGIFSGFFYSNKPFRWASRGLGEVLVGFCYGWLPIATGYYLVTGFFNHQVFLLSIPVGLSIFNAVLMNEFPDEGADRAAGKRNLVVRFGKERMSDLYLGLSILAGFSFVKVIMVFGQGPWWLMILEAAPLLFTVWNLYLVWQKGYQEERKLQILCRNALWVNLSMTMILTIQQTLIA